MGWLARILKCFSWCSKKDIELSAAGKPVSMCTGTSSLCCTAGSHESEGLQMWRCGSPSLVPLGRGKKVLYKNSGVWLERFYRACDWMIILATSTFPLLTRQRVVNLGDTLVMWANVLISVSERGNWAGEGLEGHFVMGIVNSPFSSNLATLLVSLTALSATRNWSCATSGTRRRAWHDTRRKGCCSVMRHNAILTQRLRKSQGGQRWGLQAAFWFLQGDKLSVPFLGQQGLCCIKVLIQSRW